MGFITPALLAGAALIGLPIVLHLVMRRDPRQIVFPALRFVQLRRASNQTRLRLRHLLLLVLRCAIIVLLAFALARPTLRGSGRAAGDDAPIAAALVFDNSLRMDYVYQNESRLAAAQELAAWILEQLPADTPTAVLDVGGRNSGFALDRGAAEAKVARLAPAAAAKPLHEAIGQAAALLGERPDYRGEIYVFTDLAAVDWDGAALAELAARLAPQTPDDPELSLYLIDVGVERPQNVGLAPLRLSKELLTAGETLRIESNVLRAGGLSTDENLTVELYLDDGPERALEKRGQLVVAPTASAAAAIDFRLADLKIGTHQGVVRIVGVDPLAADDARYFTVDVRPARKVLLIADRSADATFLRAALAPPTQSGQGGKFDVQVVLSGAASDVTLADYDCVCLLDPSRLADEAWQSLAGFVERGGGLGIFLGRNADRDHYNAPAAGQLLPGPLRWQSRDATYLQPSSYDHPALASLKPYADAVSWSTFPVFKYWEFEVPAGSTVVPFANGQPALIERAIGQGRVITMATSVSDPAFGEPWNLLPTGPDPWPFVALADGLVDYLSGGRDERLNYTAGQPVVLKLAPHEQVATYVLRTPGGESLRRTRVSSEEELVVSAVEDLGNYRLLAGGTVGRLDRGFSINCSGDVSALARADFQDIQTALGADRVRLARTRQEVEVRVGIGRVGRELFPWLIGLLAVVLGAENLLANRFYRNTA